MSLPLLISVSLWFSFPFSAYLYVFLTLILLYFELVLSFALYLLLGFFLGAQQIDNFSPMVECCSNSREKPQHYRWVGPPGLDSDSELKQLFRMWLQAKEEANNAASAAADVIAEISASAAGSPPPPKA